MGCGFARFMKEGEGGPGNGPLAPVDVWRGQDVHVDVAGRGRKKLPQGIAVPPSVHKADDCPPGEHRHDRFDYCHPEKRKHRGAGEPEEERPFPPYRTLKQKAREAFRELYHAKRDRLSPEGVRRLEAKYKKLRDLQRAAYDWETSPEGEAWINREKVKRAKGQGQKSPEHYAKKIAALEEKKQQLDEEHERLWEQYRMPRLSGEREHYYGELRENVKQLKIVRAGIARAKAQSTIGFVREWTGVIKDIAGGVEPQISAIRTGSRTFAHYGLDDGIIGISDRALELLAKVRDNPDILWETGPNLRPDRLAVAVSTLVHEFLHSVNPAKGAYVKGGITGMIEEGLTECIANRMVARPDVLSVLLDTEMDKGLDAKPSPEYKVYTDTMEYLAERAAQRSNTEPEWFLGKWKFHTDPRVRGDTILDDTGMSAEEGYSTHPWKDIMAEAKEKLPKMQQERQAQRVNKAFLSAVSTVWSSLWRVSGFEFKASGYPMGGPAGGHGQNFDMRHTGSETPPRGVGWEKFPRQGGESVGGTGAGAVEAAVEEPCETC